MAKPFLKFPEPTTMKGLRQEAGGRRLLILEPELERERERRVDLVFRISYIGRRVAATAPVAEPR